MALYKCCYYYYYYYYYPPSTPLASRLRCLQHLDLATLYEILDTPLSVGILSITLVWESGSFSDGRAMSTVFEQQTAGARDADWLARSPRALPLDLHQVLSCCFHLLTYSVTVGPPEKLLPVIWHTRLGSVLVTAYLSREQ